MPTAPGKECHPFLGAAVRITPIQHYYQIRNGLEWVNAMVHGKLFCHDNSCVLCGPVPPQSLPSLMNLTAPCCGGEVELPCLVGGTRPLQYFWTWDGSGNTTELDNSTGRFQLKDDGTLVIQDVGVSDEGRYTCLVLGNLGIASTILLDIDAGMCASQI